MLSSLEPFFLLFRSLPCSPFLGCLTLARLFWRIPGGRQRRHLELELGLGCWRWCCILTLLHTETLKRATPPTQTTHTVAALCTNAENGVGADGAGSNVSCCQHVMVNLPTQHLLPTCTGVAVDGLSLSLIDGLLPSTGVAAAAAAWPACCSFTRLGAGSTDARSGSLRFF